VVGCSGEEVASILKALGFRLDRRKLAPPANAEPQATDATEAPAEIFDEIWRPGKRKEARHAKGAGHRPRREARARARRPEPQQPQAHATKAERKRIEHSPFAALEALKGRLTARQPEGS
jgi:ATP-dependent RNA helicase SUPV3L1/SUV3